MTIFQYQHILNCIIKHSNIWKIYIIKWINIFQTSKMHNVTKPCMGERSIQLQDRPMDLSIRSVYWYGFRFYIVSKMNFYNYLEKIINIHFRSFQFSHSVMSDSFWPHESQHARPPCQHQLPEFTQTHVHRVGDAIQPSHPLLSPSPPAPNPSQHQSLFQWVNSSHEVAKVLEFQL